jgi:hypothetical protein
MNVNRTLGMLASTEVGASPFALISHSINLLGFSFCVFAAIDDLRTITSQSFPDRINMWSALPGTSHFALDIAQLDPFLSPVSHMQIAATAGLAVVQTDAALDELWGPKPQTLQGELYGARVSALGADVDELRGLLYMIRCAFAHDPLLPKWVIKAKYQRVFDVAPARLRVDLSNLHDTPVTAEQLEHWHGVYRLLSYARDLARPDHSTRTQVPPPAALARVIPLR